MILTYYKYFLYRLTLMQKFHTRIIFVSVNRKFILFLHSLSIILKLFYNKGIIMKKLLILLTFCTLIFAEEGVKKVVFDLTSGQVETIEKKVLSGIAFNKTHYENHLEKLDVAVVIHGDAYKFFIRDLANSPYKNDPVLLDMHDQLGKRLASMAKNYEVEFIMCESGMKSHKIDKSTLYDFVKLTPSSTIGLIDKQNEHYAYIPIH